MWFRVDVVRVDVVPGSTGAGSVPNAAHRTTGGREAQVCSSGARQGSKYGSHTHELGPDSMRHAFWRGSFTVGATVLVASASIFGSLFEGRGVAADRAGGRDVAVTTSSVAGTTTSTTTTTVVPAETPVTEAPAPAPAVPATTVLSAVTNATPPTTAAPAPGPSGLGGALLAATNADRAANGFGVLGWDGQLAGFAESWANQLAQQGSLVHQNLGVIASATGRSPVGENLFMGSSGTSAGAMEGAWMASSPHRANILLGGFTVMGVGAAVDASGHVWVSVVLGG